MVKRSLFLCLIFVMFFCFEGVVSATTDFFITSDVHIGPAGITCTSSTDQYCTNDGDLVAGAELNKTRFEKLINGINLKNASNRYLLISGDMVQRGEAEEYSNWSSTINAKEVTAKIYVSLGNHELRPLTSPSTSSEYLTLRNRFISNFGSINSKTEFEGVKIVRIGTDFDERPVVPWNRNTTYKNPLSRSSLYFYISEGTKTFLEEELEDSKNKNQTVIVLCHWPAPNTVQRSNTPPVGPQHRLRALTDNDDSVDNSVKNIIERYPNAIFVSGHSHQYFTNQWKSEASSHSLYLHDGCGIKGTLVNQGNITEFLKITFSNNKTATVHQQMLNENSVVSDGTSFDWSWEEVKYNANGGTGTVDSTYKYQNVSQNSFTKTGYTFKNWNTKADGTGTTYNPGVTINEGDITLYAIWEKETYSITYDLNGGVATNPSSYDVETNTFTLNNPTKDNYVFTGWTGSNGNTPETTVSIPRGSTGNKTYTANWEAENYTITYNLDGGVATNPGSYTVETETFALNEPVKEGYFFKGWTGSNGTTPQKNITITQGSSGNRTYTANYLKQVIPTVNCSNKTYDKTTSATCDLGLIGTAASSEVTVTGTCDFSDSNAGENKTVTCLNLTLGGPDADLYVLSKTSETAIANILKATPIITLSSASGSVENGNSTSFTEKANVDGGFANTSTHSSIATASPENYNSVSANTEKTVTVTGQSVGSAVINIVFTPDDITNYNTSSENYDVSVIAAATASPGTCSNPIYNGDNQTLASGGVNVDYTNNSAKDYKNGGYEVKVVPKSGYTWSNGTTDEKTLNCNITKKDATIKAKDQTIEFGNVISKTLNDITSAGLISGHAPVSVTLTQSTTEITTTGKITPSEAVIEDNGDDVTNNYNIEYSQGDLIITKIAATCPTIESYTGEYDGNSHSISVSDDASGGEVQYSTDESDVWTTVKPERTDGGETIVNVRVEGDSNHNTKSCGSKKITITPKEVETPSTPAPKTYTGSEQQSGITCPIESVAGGTQKATNANESGYTQTCSLSSTNNYKWSDGTTSVKSIIWIINKKDVTIKAKDQTIEFGNVISKTLNDITSEGLVSGHSPSSVALNQSTTAVTTTGKITPSEAVIKDSSEDDVTNNYSIEYEKGNLTITKVDATCPTTTENYTGEYDGNGHSISVSNDATGGEVQYSINDSDEWTNIKPEITDGGETTVNIRVEGDSNHNTKSCGSKKITITPKEVETPSTPAPKTYTGTEQQSGITCPIGSVAGGTQKATNANESGYTQTCSLSSTNNYKWSDGTTSVKSIVWIINKKDATIKAKDQTIGQGSEISKTPNDVTDLGLVSGHSVASITLTQSTTEITTTGKITASNAVIKDSSNSDVTNNYNIEYEQGNLTITTVIICRVSFDTNGGREIPSIEVNKGSKLSGVETPIKEGYRFVGWYKDQNLTTEYDFDEAVMEDMTLYAKWEINYYTVSIIDSIDGSQVEILVVEGEKVTRPTDPIKRGYKFKGWYGDEALTSEFDFDQRITKNTSIYSKWEKEKYQINFDTNGGNTIPKAEVYYGDKLTRPTDPIKNGYEFKGWYKDESLSEIYDFDSTVEEEFTIYAKWKVKTHTVTFNTNGGTPIASIEVNELDIVEEPEEPIKENYRFAGWYTDPELTDLFSFGTTITKDYTLYAKWVDEGYIIKYNLDGGINNPDNPTSYKEFSEIEIKAPTKKGYKFIGWYIDEGYTKPLSGVPSDIKQDLTLYAKWEKITYRIKFETNGGNKIEDYIYSTEEDIELPTPTKNGYTFAGWYIDKELNNKFNAHEPIENDITLYAKWIKASEKTYKITFKTNGGSFVFDIIAKKGDKITAPMNPIKENYRFAGWYSDKALTKLYTFTVMPGKNITLYAKWVSNNENIIIYDTGGIENDTSNPTSFKDGESKTIKAPIEKAKLKFKGWYDENNKKVTNTDKVKGDQKLHAKWDDNEKNPTIPDTGSTKNAVIITIGVLLLIAVAYYIYFLYKKKKDEKDNKNNK